MTNGVCEMNENVRPRVDASLCELISSSPSPDAVANVVNVTQNLLS